MFTEKSNFYLGEFTKNQFNIEGRIALKKGSLSSLQILARKWGGGVFEWGVDSPMHTMYNLVLKLQQIERWGEDRKKRNYFLSTHVFGWTIYLAYKKVDNLHYKVIYHNSNLQKECKKNISC